MKKRCVMSIICLGLLLGPEVPINHSANTLFAATTLTGNTVEAIDSTGLSITVQTPAGGDTLSIPVVSPEVMKGIAVGDRVSLEIDVEGRVVKILRLGPALKEAPEPRG